MCRSHRSRPQLWLVRPGRAVEKTLHGERGDHDVRAPCWIEAPARLDIERVSPSHVTGGPIGIEQS